MVAFPHCKINLGLQITGKRADGYHELRTCFYPVPFCDILEVIPGASRTFTTSGNSIPGNDHDNLCLKAADLARETFGVPAVRIHLHKSIPTGAGLGGGSSDGAWTFRLLHAIFPSMVDERRLPQLAAQLGSDCSFFLQDGPMFGTGRGEILAPAKVSLKDKYLVLLKPSISVSTAEAYKSIIPQVPSFDVVTQLEGTPLEMWRSILKNDFEKPVFAMYPSIGALKEELYASGAVYAAMSGSGSAVFGIFDLPVDLRKRFGGNFCWQGKLV